jgi:hypothetical protein
MNMFGPSLEVSVFKERDGSGVILIDQCGPTLIDEDNTRSIAFL